MQANRVYSDMGSCWYAFHDNIRKYLGRAYTDSSICCCWVLSILLLNRIYVVRQNLCC